MSGSRGEITKLLRRARKQGLSVERTGGGHWKVTAPDVDEFVTVAFSPRSPNMKNIEKDLKKLGFVP